MFIISLTYKSDLEEVDKLLDDHVVYLKKEYANGNFIASGRKLKFTFSQPVCFFFLYAYVEVPSMSYSTNLVGLYN